MTATVFIMVLAAAALHAAWNTALKVNTDRLVFMAMIAAGQGIASLAGLLIVEAPARAAWPYLLVSVVLHNGYFLLLALAYRYGDLSHVYPLARGSAPLIVAIASAYFAGEVLETASLLGVTLISIGVMSLALVRGAGCVNDLRAVSFALATGAFIAAYSVVDGLGARLAGSPHGYTFWLLALHALPLMALVAIRRRGNALRDVRRVWKTGLAAGMISLVAYWIVIWAMTRAPIAMVSALRETGMVFAVLFGIVVLKERVDLRRVTSTFVTLGGAILLKTAR